jgi:phenylpyruvate tautomerase PptA (4-oxalocrotonate tautomerase family)
VSDGTWTLGTFNGAGQILLTPIGNTKGFGDLGDGGHLMWVGDFTGSGKSQILFNYVGDGNWWLGTVVGLQISFTKVGNTLGFGNLADGFHPSWTGDFTNSGKTQVLFNYVGDGNWWLGTIADGQISFSRVGNTLGFGNIADGKHPSWVGDFTGDGKADIVFNYVGDGNWWLGTFVNGQLLFARVGNTLGFGNIADGKHPSWVGNFTQTGSKQVVFNYVGDGNWWLGTLTNGQLTFALVGNTVGFGDIADGKHPSWSADFTGGNNTEILFNYVGDGNWWLGTFVNGRIAFSKVANTIGFGDLADGSHPSLTGNFTGSSNSEVLFNYYGDGNWWLGSCATGSLVFTKAGTTV